MRNWKEVPLPPKMQGMKKDARGLPVPYIVMWDKFNKPMFTVNDAKMVEKAIAEKRCAICGGYLKEDMWLLGGIMSAFHPQGAYIDTPIHHECGTYALLVCPYLAMSSYNGKADAEKLKERVADQNVIFVDPTVLNSRPVCFAFVHITGFHIIPVKRYLVPDKPYLEVEYWDSGVKLTKERGEEIRKELKLP